MYSGAGPEESSNPCVQPGGFGVPGGEGRRGDPSLRRAAALLQHPLSAVDRTTGGRGVRPERQVIIHVSTLTLCCTGACHQCNKK